MEEELHCDGQFLVSHMRRQIALSRIKCTGLGAEGSGGRTRAEEAYEATWNASPSGTNSSAGPSFN